MRSLRTLALGFIAATVLAAAPALAQQYSNDFSTGPGFATLYGNAAVTGGYLRLTQAINGQNGAIVLNTYAGGAKAFDATFSLYYNSPGTHRADGVSFNLGVLPDGVLPGAAENGPGNGLTVTFDTFDFNNDGIDVDAGIRVYYNGAIVASAAGAINLFGDLGQVRPVHIFLDYSGNITVSYNGATPINGVPTGFVPQPAQRFGLAARTGGENAEYRIDDLIVRPYYAQPSCSNAAPIIGDGIWGYSYDTIGSVTEGDASCQPGNTCRDVWFCWLATATGTVTLTNDGLTDDDSVISVYDGCYPCPSGFSEIACNDDINYPSNSASRVTFAAKAGATYGVRIALFTGSCGSASGLEGFSITTHADCPADFNHDGTRNVADIFAFLGSWFAGCP